MAAELAEELDLAQGGDGDALAGAGDANLLDGDEAAGLKFFFFLVEVEFFSFLAARL